MKNINNAKSPSSRRAWVEIGSSSGTPKGWWTSPSSRRAWVEIPSTVFKEIGVNVALLAEGVGRNLCDV